MSTAPTQTNAPPQAQRPTGRAGKIVLRVILVLLIVVLGLEAVSLLAGQQTEQKRRAIGRAGGKCTTERRVPAWLASVAGEDFHTFMDHPVITEVSLKGEAIGDDNLARLPVLPDVHLLDLQDARITSEGLKHISGWENLRILNLRNSTVTDITPLAALPRLESLQLTFSQVRREHLAGLSQLKHLKELGAAYIQVTDREVAEIAKCAQLVNLSIAGADLGDQGLQPLAALKNLKTLVLLDAKFNPADLEALQAASPNLTRIVK